MKTAKYIIILTSIDKEHKKVRKLVNALFEELRFKVEGDIEFYVQPVEKNKYNWGVQSLGSKDRKHLIF